MKLASVIIVARNEAKNIEKCVGGIYRQKSEFEVEVVLIDSSSDDDTVKLAKQWPVQVRVIPREEFHHGRTRNLGASMAQGQFLVFLQGDAWAASDHWLQELLAPFSDATVACVYGRQLPNDHCDPINRFRTGWNYQGQRIDKHLGLKPKLAHRLYFFSTANCSIRRGIWEQYKFPEDIHIFEDSAFSRKVIGDGHKIVYTPNAEVIHSHNLGVKEILKRYLNAGYVQAKYAFTDRQDQHYRSEGLNYLKQGLRQIYGEAGSLWAMRFMWHTFAGYIGLTWGQMLFKAGVQMK
jgi:rhamnosyltransferase